MATPPTTPPQGSLNTQGPGEIAQTAALAVDVGQTLIAVAKTLQGSLSTILSMKIDALVEGGAIDLMSKTFDSYKAAVRKQEDLDRQTVQTSALLERITGLNAIARKEFATEADMSMKGGSLLSAASKNMYAAVQEYAGQSIKLLDGSKRDAVNLFGDVDSLFKTFTDTLADDTRLQAAALQGLTYDLTETMKLANENLNISTSTMNDIFQKELSATGKITGEYLKDYEKGMVATAQLTGVSVDLIGKDLARMTSDFGHFGMMSNEQMLSLSVNLKNLGLDITDVTRLSDNFSSFDKAAATMSNLAASTGATLDTLELFKLANTDQEAFLASLKDQLESQGVEFENLNIIQQKQIASSFGIDPRILQRLLSDNFDAIDNIADEIGQKKSNISDDTLRSTVAGMGSLRDELEKVDLRETTLMVSSLKNVSAETAESLEHVYRSTLQFADVGVERLSEGITSMVKQAQVQRGELLKVVYEGIKGIANDKTVKDRYTDLGKQAAQATAEGLAFAGPEVRKVGVDTGLVLVEGFQWGSRYLTKHNSPSEAGNDMIEGIKAALEKMEKDELAKKSGEGLSKQMIKAISDAKSEFTDKFKEFNDIMLIESAKGKPPIDRLKERFKGVFTDEQITRIVEGKGSEIAASMAETSVKSKLDEVKATAAAEADKAKNEAPEAKKRTEKAIAESAERLVNIKITLAGGDELTQLLAKHIISAGLSGITTDSGQVVHLAVSEQTDRTTN